MADAPSFVLPQDTHSMPLLAHLEELRKRIIFSVLGVLVGFLSCWSFADRIFSLVQQPLIQALRRHGLSGGLVYLNPTEPFNLYLEVGFVAGLFAASPFVFYQLCCSSLLHTRHFCCRGNGHTDRREHVPIRCPDGRAIRHQYWSGMAGEFST
jgi:hypothetical protein